MNEIDVTIMELAKKNKAYIQENIQLHKEIEQEKSKISEMAKKIQMLETECAQKEKEYTQKNATLQSAILTEQAKTKELIQKNTDMIKLIEQLKNEKMALIERINQIIEQTEEEYDGVFLAQSGTKVLKRGLEQIKEVIK